MGAIDKRALLDQRSVLITADDPQVVTLPAAGAHEVQPEAVDVGLDLTEPGGRLAAADALEHDLGVRPGGDGEATAGHSARHLEMVERVAKAMQAAEQVQTCWAWEDCSPLEVEGWMDLARAAITVLAPPDGYVLVPVVPTKQMLDAAVPASSQDQTGRRQRAMWDAMLAARPEVL